jgi:hypothetical protein
VFLAEPIQKRRRRIGAMASEQLHVKNQFCVDVYCSVQPRPLAVQDFESPEVVTTTTKGGKKLAQINRKFQLLNQYT